MTLRHLRSRGHSKNLINFSGMVNGSGQTRHMLQAHGALCHSNGHTLINLPIGNSTTTCPGYVALCVLACHLLSILVGADPI
jgi:hypothetical protein